MGGDGDGWGDFYFLFSWIPVVVFMSFVGLIERWGWYLSEGGADSTVGAQAVHVGQSKKVGVLVYSTRASQSAVRTIEETREG